MNPGVGDHAPDPHVLDIEGEVVPLSRSWTGQPAVVAFLRYFGCPFCQAQVVSLREAHPRFADLGARIVLIGQGTPTDCADFCTRKRVEFDVYLDPSRAAFRAFGLLDASLLQVAGPAVILPWLKHELRSDTRQAGLKGGSFMQMPGTFVIDDAGIVRFAHRNRHVADSPRTEALLDAIAEQTIPLRPS